MPEPGDEQLPATPRSARAAIGPRPWPPWSRSSGPPRWRSSSPSTGGTSRSSGCWPSPPSSPPPFARPSRVALVGILTAFFALIISTPPHSYGQLNHTLRVVTMLAATAVAMWISYLRGQRNVQLWTARSETRNERRRRVAAETAQRMQTMARALTTAADPAQVADAVFAALRDELRVDASTFALLDERGVAPHAPALRLRPRRPVGRGAGLVADRRPGPGPQRRLLLRDDRRPAARAPRHLLVTQLEPVPGPRHHPAGRLRPHHRRRRRALGRRP